MRHRFYPFEQKPFHLAHRGPYFNGSKYEQDLLWQKLTDHLQDLGRKRVLSTHALVMMSNHIHLLWSPWEKTKEEGFAKLDLAIVDVLKCSLPHWEECIFSIESFYQYHEVYKYIYRNPVVAGLARRVEDYSYSTLQNVLGKQRVLVGLQDPFGVIFDQFRVLEWLNTSQTETRKSARSFNRC